MVVSTIYDKDLKERVFQVRDSERYTNSTITTLEATYNNSFRNYLSVTLTPTVYKNLGSSSIAFYDGEEYLGVVSCVQGTSPSPLTTKVPYGHHSFWAKYMGNAECLSSRSGIVEVTVDEPDLIHTAFDLSDIKEYYFKRRDINEPLLATMINEDTGEVILDEALKFYLNNVLVGYVYSDDILYNTLHMDVGEYTCKIVFDGDDEYFGCETEFTFKVQENDYLMDIDYPTTKLALNEPITIKATLSNVDLTPKVGTTLYLKHGVTVVDTKTTNSDGEVTYNTSFNNSDLYITDNEYIYESLYTESPSVITHIQIQSDEFTRIGQVIPITVSFDNVSNLLVHVDNEDFVTDSSGQVIYKYQGTGVGNKTITASAGEFSASKTIKDLLMYFNNAKNINYGLNYMVGNSLAATIMSAGFQLVSPNDKEGMLYFYLENTPSDWSLEFDVISSIKNVTPSTNLMVDGVYVSDSILNNKPTIRVTKQNNLVTVYSNGNSVGSVTSYDMFPTLKLGLGQTLVIDNIKYMRL